MKSKSSARFACYEDALGFYRRTFDWDKHEHHHSGIAMPTPAKLHYGQPEQVLTQRQRVLARGIRRPSRTFRPPPKVPSPPQAVWIRPPEDKNSSEIKFH